MTYLSDNDWKLPLNLAIGFHILIIVGVLYLPDFFHPKPLFKDIYTVDLISIPEPVLEQAAIPSAPQPEAVKPVPKKPAPKKAVSIAPPEPAPVAPKTKAISIKPLKRKIKKKVPPVKKTVEQKRNKEQEKLRRKQLADALRAEQLAAERAKTAAEEAVKELKQMLQTANALKPSTTAAKKRTTPARGSINAATSALQNRYYGLVNNQIQQYWALPEYKVWDASLVAIVVITVNKDGTIANQFFEKRSGDRVFDQFVQKTIQDAAPLPSIPSALKKNRMEFGLRFTPSGIQR